MRFSKNKFFKVLFSNSTFYFCVSFFSFMVKYKKTKGINVMTKPSFYHSQGYNCAESIIKSYNEEFNKEIPVSMGSAMGTGASVGSLCGAVNACVMVVGYIKGRESNLDVNQSRVYSKMLMNKIRENYKSEICIDLKKSGVSCDEIIDFSYEVLKEIL